MSKARPPADHDENPEWTRADFSQARPAGEVHGKKAAGALVRRAGRPRGSDKERISIRLDKDVLAKFRGTGPGWQTRINEVLKRARV